MKTFFYLLILSQLCLASACTKDNMDELPPATQVGANTFGCKINGVVYSCTGLKNPNSILTMEGIYYFEEINYAHITALIYKPEKRNFFDFDFDFKTGIYRNGIKVNTGNILLNSDSYVMITNYTTDIISGTFQMDVEFDDGEIWNITDGRFDIKKNN